MTQISVLPRLLRLAVATGALAFATMAFGETFMGEQVFQRDFRISGGQTVSLPVTSKGPIPATADGVTVEFVSPIPVTTGPKFQIFWAFSVSVPKGVLYQSAEIVDVTGEPPVFVMAQERPAAQSVSVADGSVLNVLQLRGADTEVSPANMPWVYQDGMSVFVFRITLKDTAGKTLVLYQPAMFGDAGKIKMRNMAKSQR